MILYLLLVFEKSVSDVFKRLGSTEVIKPDTTTNMKPDSTQINKPKNIFARLGGKDKVSDVSTDNFIKKPCQQTVVMKAISQLPLAPKKLIINSNGAVRTLRQVPMRTMQADKKPISVRDKLTMPTSQRKSVKFSPLVDYKLIESRKTELPVQKTSVANIVMAHMNDKNTEQKSNVKLRLGNKTVNNGGVFSRLGVNGSRHQVL